MEINEQVQKQVISRLRRIAGQAHSLETMYVSGDVEKFTLQLEAVIAAAKSCLSFVAVNQLIDSEDPSDKQLIARLLKKG